MDLIASSFATVFTPGNLLLMLAAIVGGLVAGALPGFTATMAVALMIPFTFTMNPTTGLIVLGAIYMSAIYGGSFSAILINTPGTPSSIGTTFDGYPMAKKGEGEKAIVTATVSSVIGGLVGVVALLFLSPPLAQIALKFGPPEYFWVAIFGLTIISSLSSGSLAKGWLGGCIGLLLSAIGIAPIGGDIRFTFDRPELQGGIPLVVALIGFFTIPEILSMVARGHKAQVAADYVKRKGVFWQTTRQVLAQPGNLLRSSILGTIIGILPGAGGNIANLVAYNETKRASKHPEKFGTGIVDGVIATESSNNATVGGGLIPLLTLGVPGTPVDAVIYGALMLQGLRPGAQLFTENAGIVYAFILSLFVATLLMAPIGIYGGRWLNRFINKVSLRYLAPAILFLAILGSYAIDNSIPEVFMMLIFGVIAYVLRELGFDAAPIVLGLILGPLAEQGLVQSMLMGTAMAQPWLILFTRPISIILIVLSLVSAAWPLVVAYRKRRRDAEQAEVKSYAQS